MVIHIKNIILGWFSFLFKKSPKFSKERMNICKTCENNDNGWCTLCGCYLKAKVRVKDEICHANKWQNVNENGNC